MVSPGDFVPLAELDDIVFGGQGWDEIDGGDPLRPGIVHRLDKDTSGLMAVALDDEAHRHLAAQLEDRRMGRTYHTNVDTYDHLQADDLKD